MQREHRQMRLYARPPLAVELLESGARVLAASPAAGLRVDFGHRSSFYLGHTFSPDPSQIIAQAVETASAMRR